jgi:hypothetical protein
MPISVPCKPTNFAPDHISMKKTHRGKRKRAPEPVTVAKKHRTHFDIFNKSMFEPDPTYFARRSGDKCTMTSLNNLLGGAIMTVNSMERVRAMLLREHTAIDQRNHRGIYTPALLNCRISSRRNRRCSQDTFRLSMDQGPIRHDEQRCRYSSSCKCKNGNCLRQ